MWVICLCTMLLLTEAFLAILHQCLLQYSRENNAPLKLQEAVLGNHIWTEAAQKRHWDLINHNESQRQNEWKRPLDESEKVKENQSKPLPCVSIRVSTRGSVFWILSLEFFATHENKWKESKFTGYNWCHTLAEHANLNNCLPKDNKGLMDTDTVECNRNERIRS